MDHKGSFESIRSHHTLISAPVTIFVGNTGCKEIAIAHEARFVGLEPLSLEQKTSVSLQLAALILTLVSAFYSYAETCQKDFANDSSFQKPKLSALFDRLIRNTQLMIAAPAGPPRGLHVQKLDLTASDEAAVAFSRANKLYEVAYIEVVDSSGEILFRSDMLLGEKESVLGATEKMWDAMRFLRTAKLFDEPFTVREVHTHPLTIGNSSFSAADIRAMLYTLVHLELSGFKKAKLEFSMMYPSWLTRTFTKKSILVEPDQLSFRRGDYSFDRKVDKFIRDLTPEKQKRIGDL